MAAEGDHPLQPYRGLDRRAGARAVGLAARPLLAWTAGAFVALLVLSASVLYAAPGFAEQLWVLALALWTTLGFGAGVALLVAWRVGGWATPARVGTAVLAAGVLVSLVPRLSIAVGAQSQFAAARPVVLAAILLAAGIQCGRALDGCAVDTTVQPVRDLGLLIALTLVGLLTGRAALALGLVGDLQQVRLLPALACGVSAAWVAVSARREHGPVVAGLIGFWVLIAAGSLAHTIASPVAGVLAATLAATSAVLVAAVAAGYVRVALAVHDLRSLRTLAALAERTDAAQRERERRHDALNALAAIRSASDVLTSSADSLDPATRAQLVRATREELSRVERMLAPAPASGPREVRLDDALRPVLVTWQQRGLAVQSALDEAVVLAETDVVCRIVDNLLQNAHRHAGGGAVRLSVERGPGAVHLDVVDDGPGLPAQRASTASGPAVAGQGVGLTSARRLARDAGGDLQLIGEAGCGWGVRVTLPAPPVARPRLLAQQAG
jgi:signal transduction histidine kinase